MSRQASFSLPAGCLKEYNITMIDWSAVKEELLKKEGIGKIKDAHQKKVLSACAERCLEEAKRLARPKVVSSIKPIYYVKKFSLGKKISSYIKGADEICLFLATLGNKLEDEASRLMKEGQQLQGYLLDSIGSIAAEDLAEDFEESLRNKKALKNRSVSNRFSPGYCQWPLKDQPKLDKMLVFHKAGVKLTKSFMMTPKKSISGIIGIGPRKVFSKRKSHCSICNMKDCSYRRKA